MISLTDKSISKNHCNWTIISKNLGKFRGQGTIQDLVYIMFPG